jgi:ceramide glucosyltransferase
MRPKPGVSVLRPLKGLDPNLYDNLLSSCTQEYDGPLELIFSVASAEDPSIRVVEELINRFGGEAGRDISLIVGASDDAGALRCPARDRTLTRSTWAGDTDLGPNPKLNNLYQPFNKAKYDLLYVLDSGILLASPQHLARSVDAFLLSPSFEQQGKRRVSLVHHVPFAVIPPPGNRGLGSWLERAFLNTNHAKMYLAINRWVLQRVGWGPCCAS